MMTFPVEDDVVALVWAQAKPQPFEQLSFSAALRRILKGGSQGLAQTHPASTSTSPVPTAEEMLAELEALPSRSSHQRGRAPKADLRELVRLGILTEGQELVFVDYKGNSQRKHKAKIVGADLAYRKVRYSMSALSSLLLKQEGFVADSVRGPDHWATAEGKRVREMWEEVLKQRSSR